MGMFDYVECEMELPDDPKLGGYQTKDTPDQYMTTYTITKDGRLKYKPYTMETVPKEERPYPDAEEGTLMALGGCMRRVEEDEVDTNHHGDIFFYTGDSDKNWHEYKARFTDGLCKKIVKVENDPI